MRGRGCAQGGARPVRRRGLRVGAGVCGGGRVWRTGRVFGLCSGWLVSRRRCCVGVGGDKSGEWRCDDVNRTGRDERRYIDTRSIAVADTKDDHDGIGYFSP